jgi:hypothetical protein
MRLNDFIYLKIKILVNTTSSYHYLQEQELVQASYHQTK